MESCARGPSPAVPHSFSPEAAAGACWDGSQATEVHAGTAARPVAGSVLERF